MTPQGTYNKGKRETTGIKYKKTYKPLMGGWEGGQA